MLWSISLNSFVLLEHLAMLLTSTLAINKLRKLGYRYHKLRKIFYKFYRRYYDLISKFKTQTKNSLSAACVHSNSVGTLRPYLNALFCHQIIGSDAVSFFGYKQSVWRKQLCLKLCFQLYLRRL